MVPTVVVPTLREKHAKDGAPSVLVVPAESEAWATRQSPLSTLHSLEPTLTGARFVVPTRRKARRVGQPLSWWCQELETGMCGPAPRDCLYSIGHGGSSKLCASGHLRLTDIY